MKRNFLASAPGGIFIIPEVNLLTVQFNKKSERQEGDCRQTEGSSGDFRFLAFILCFKIFSKLIIAFFNRVVWFLFVVLRHTQTVVITSFPIPVFF